MEIKSYEEKYLVSLNELLEKSFGLKKVGKTSYSDVELLAVIDEKVVGYLVLNRMVDGVRGKLYFHVNYVCCHPDFRNQHIATRLMEEAFSICKEEGGSYLELTSNSSRKAAHHLYQKLGFQIRETTVFRKEIL